jgi:hypothetical protein
MAINTFYKPFITTTLNSIGYAVGLSSMAISLMENRYISILMPSYIILGSYLSDIIESTFGKQGARYSSILDPTNAINIVLIRPHIKDAIDILEHISDNEGIVYRGDTEIIKGLMYDRNAASLTSAGTNKDLMRVYAKFNISEYSPFYETSYENQSYALNSGTSALLKYSIIYACRQLIPTSSFIGRNDLCAGIGEGGLLAINQLLEDKYSLDSIITRSAFEFVAYDSADRARSFTMNQLTYSESPTNIDIFLSEFAYGITINSYRLIRPYVEHYIKNGIKNISDLFVEAQQEYKYCIDDLLYSILDLNYDDISTADWNY